jgi:hypothetical protein
MNLQDFIYDSKLGCKYIRQLIQEQLTLKKY